MNLFKKFPSAAILTAAALWGLTGIFVRTLNSAGIGNIQLLFFRSIVTAVTMIIFLLLTDRNKLKINPRDLWYFFGTGILSFLLFGYCYFYTISNATMSIAAILLYTSPFFVMIMSALFFKEKITPRGIAALIAAAMGCFLICGTGGGKLTVVTFFTGIASGFCYALYSIFGRVALKKYSPDTVTAYTFIFAAAGSLPIADLNSLSSITDDPKNIVLTVIFCVISAVLPYLFYTNGLKHTEAGKASIMATLEAVVASAAGILVFGEPVTASGIIGTLLVISAITALNLEKR